jgi:Domain of unknown function (DUF4845)
MRTMSRNQRGITLIGFVFMLCIGGFFALIAMKLIPVYIEYYGVVKSMDIIKNEPGAANKTIDEVRRSLSLKFGVQYVDDKTIPPQNIKLIREGGNVTLRISYEKRVPFLYNIDFLCSFSKSVDLSRSTAD